VQSNERLEPVGTTLTTSMNLLGVHDTLEGFRILVQDDSSPAIGYTIRADVVYYQKSNASPDVLNTSDPSDRLLFLVHNSELVRSLVEREVISVPRDEELKHYALRTRHDERIDLVCRGEVRIRLAGSE
jgi:hypothetical protein